MAKLITSKFDGEDGCEFYEFPSRRSRPVALFFVNRWLRGRVLFAKSVSKGSGVMLCELLSNSVLELYKQVKLVLRAKHVWTWRGDSRKGAMQPMETKKEYVNDREKSLNDSKESVFEQGVTEIELKYVKRLCDENYRLIQGRDLV
nr:unnamed protein product [Callosobruchus analis]